MLSKHTHTHIKGAERKKKKMISPGSTDAAMTIVLDTRDACTGTDERGFGDGMEYACVERDDRDENRAGAEVSQALGINRDDVEAQDKDLPLFTPESVDTVPKLPRLAPLEDYGKYTLLTAFNEERSVEDTDILYDESCSAAAKLGASGVLDKYVLNEKDATAICAAAILIKKGFNISMIADSCTKEKPGKLMVMILSALRKLPRYKGVLYYGSCTQTKRRTLGRFIQHSFAVMSKDMSTAMLRTQSYDSGNCCELFKEVRRVEGGWGYDISEFCPEAEGPNNNGDNSTNIVFYHPLTYFIVCLSRI